MHNALKKGEEEVVGAFKMDGFEKKNASQFSTRQEYETREVRLQKSWCSCQVNCVFLLFCIVEFKTVTGMHASMKMKAEFLVIASLLNH